MIKCEPIKCNTIQYDMPYFEATCDADFASHDIEWSVSPREFIY